MGIKLATFAALSLTVPVLAQTAAPAPPQAQVTFYSHGVTVLGGLPGQQHGAFKGRIYDGDHQLAFMEPAHFVTFSFAPGTHLFSATWWTTKHAKSGAHVTLDLVAGRHYFLETFVVDTSLLMSVKLYVHEVTCEAARQDNVTTKPLEATHLRPDGIPLAVHETTFPSCP